MSGVCALVLAAGLGTRLDPLTRLVAKPAVPLGDRTLIEHVLAWVRAQGIRDVVVNLHHRPESITAVVGDGAHLGLSVRYSWEQDVLGSAGGPRHALPLLTSNPFLIVNGDTLCDFELAPMLDEHRRSGAGVTMAVVPNAAPDRYNGIALDGDQIVRGFLPRGQADDTWHFVGVQIASAGIFAPLADNVRHETVSEIYRQLVLDSPGVVRGWPVETSFLDVGTPRDYLDAAVRVATGGRMSGATDSIIWPEARVDPDAQLTRCIVAGPVHVPAGMRAEDAILMPADTVQPGDSVEIVGPVARWPAKWGQILN